MTSEALAHVSGPALTNVENMIWIDDIPRRGAAIAPKRPAIIFPDGGRTVTYAELENASNAFAAYLAECGIARGERIAYLGRNSDLYFAVLFGSIRAGAVLVALNWRLTAAEIHYQLDDSRSRIVFSDADFIPTAQRAAEGIAAPPRIVPTEGDHGLQGVLRRAAAPVAAARDDRQVILQLYTSGTTGKPKGVQITHRGISVMRHAELNNPDMQYMQQECTTLSAMPNFHIGGMSWVLMGLMRMGTVVLTGDATPGNLLRLLNEYRSEYTFIVPTVLRALIDEIRRTGQSAPRIAGIFYGAMPIGESLLRDAITVFNCRLMQFFGMTEVAGSATYLPPRDHNPANVERLKSVGLPYMGMSLEIRRPDRSVCARGEHGEIWIKTPTLMLGYWNLPEKTAEAVVDGWYASGDGGYLDNEGFLFLTDRIKDMIVSGGENVYPAEVEEVLRQHPSVQDAAVIGIADPYWGESVTAVVELRPSHTLDVNELLSFASERIARFKCPKRIEIIDALPRTASGKVRRAELRASMKKP
jgi:acyl-CoA synthetase (AMP-forming)/AMP-acid ligase II